jgi:hypothetical protein
MQTIFTTTIAYNTMIDWRETGRLPSCLIYITFGGGYVGLQQCKQHELATQIRKHIHIIHG